MSHGENKGVNYAGWLHRDNNKRRSAQREREANRAVRLMRRDLEWERAMGAAGCAVERVRLMDDGTVVRWRGNNCPWGAWAEKEVVA